MVRAPMGPRTDLLRVTSEKPGDTISLWSGTIAKAEIEANKVNIDAYLADFGKSISPTVTCGL